MRPKISPSINTPIGSGFFITGTDTEIGKTLVAGALILKLSALGYRVAGFKPVVAGTYRNTHGDLVNEDLETLQLASNLALDQNLICPYILDIPAAPHLIVKAYGKTLELKSITDSYHLLKKTTDQIIVEGTGGFLVPLNPIHNFGDVAKAINLPIILVVGMRLGCINHALLTVESILNRQLSIAGWIANTLDDKMTFLTENIQSLQERIAAPFCGLIPKLSTHLQKPDNAPYSKAALQFAANAINLSLLKTDYPPIKT